mgnify:CR=1 FL=1
MKNIAFTAFSLLLLWGCSKPEACIEANDRYFQPPPGMFEIRACGSAETYFWDFGDGNGNEGRLVSHIYDTSGSYVVEQFALQKNGRREQSVTHQVEIGYKRIDSIVFNRLSLSVWDTSKYGRGPNLYLQYGNFEDSEQVYNDFSEQVNVNNPLTFTFTGDTRLTASRLSDGLKIRDRNNLQFTRDVVIDSIRTTNALEDVDLNPQTVSGELQRSDAKIYWSFVY